MRAFEFEAAAVPETMAAERELGYETLTRPMAIAARWLDATRGRLLQVRVAGAERPAAWPVRPPA